MHGFALDLAVTPCRWGRALLTLVALPGLGPSHTCPHVQLIHLCPSILQGWHQKVSAEGTVVLGKRQQGRTWEDRAGELL